MEEYLPLIIQLISGALGGNVAGKLLKNLSLGTAGNSIAGILGGGLGGYLLGLLGMGAGAASGTDMSAATDAVAGGGMDLTSILTSVAGGGVGGGALMAIVGAVKNAMGK